MVNFYEFVFLINHVVVRTFLYRGFFYRALFISPRSARYREASLYLIFKNINLNAPSIRS